MTFCSQVLPTECSIALSTALETCRWLGVPVAEQKTVGPQTSITFLGIEIDTVKGELSFPRDKLLHIRATLKSWKSWRGQKRCSKRELLSLLGTLHHAATVVKPGRIFLRRIIELSTVAAQLHFIIRLNRSFQADLEWWSTFIEEWNGIGILRALGVSQPDLSVQSDASGKWGCGAVYNRKWFQLQWPPEWLSIDIAVKELLAIVLAAATWGHHWRGLLVLFVSDNSSAVYNINSGTSKHPHMMQLVRALHYIAATHNFVYRAQHLKGTLNVIADSLSRTPVTSDFLHSFQANPSPSPVPLELLNLLAHNQTDWLAPDWRRRFTSFIVRA